MNRPAVLFDESHCEQCACGEGLDFRLTFAFQPIVDMATRSVFAYEALVRGLEGQGAWEILQKVDKKNRYAFDQVCRVRAVALAARLNMQTYLSINFMPNAVYKAEYCIRTTLAAAKKYKFDTRKIIFEMIEDEALTSPEHLISIMDAYKGMEFQTALDDFGAGYSRYEILIASPPHFLKLDMSLIRDIDQQPNKQAVIRGILETMRHLNVRVIAEGVETQGEYDWLKEQGISLYQGYLFAKPGFECLPEPYYPD
ncbi:MAG: diguanylate phosphodiesterase [Alteromonadaceae bacterium]|nr:diguanylate phosphodiesterase [Alteromonadaceae bacterium]MBH84486.1 diguanylate phosphodiesterase [Alteromonadaceae bacterium]|tara:strand:- start:5449 stop:6213 length:765 start_codon:yes stop_codon:yes gene_type:complete